jgi:hypothetical protein
MPGNTSETANELSWPEGSATLVDRPLDPAGDRGLEWDEDEGQTVRVGKLMPAEARAVQWVGMVGVSSGPAPPLRVLPLRGVAARPGLRRLSPAARAFLEATQTSATAPAAEPRVAEPRVSQPLVAKPLVVEPYVADRTERTPRPRLSGKAWAGLAAGMLALSVVLLVVAMGVAGSRHVGAVPARATAPIAAPPLPRASPRMPAVIEAVDAVPVRATAATAGVVRRAVARGGALRAGDVLVELRRPNPAAARRLAELNELLDAYDDAGDHAGELARARAAYERAAQQPTAVTVRAPTAGVVVGDPPRPGAAVEPGDELSRLAASVRLIVGAGDVEGDAARCRVLLLDRPGVLLDGRLLPGVPDAHSRTIEVAAFPANLPLGTVGRVRAICL